MLVRLAALAAVLCLFGCDSAFGPDCKKGCRCGNTCIDCSKRCTK